MIFCGSNDLFVQAESNDTHYDHDLKIFGSRLGHYVPYASNDAKSYEIGDYEGFFFLTYLSFNIVFSMKPITMSYQY